MKIKKIGWTSFLISTDDISVLTDPLLLKESGASFPKTQVDVCLFTNCVVKGQEGALRATGLDQKVFPDKRKKVIEICTAGEYEVGGIMIRRGLNDDFYIIDEKNLRVVYMGGTGKDIDPEEVKNLGDVDALILPVGDGELFIDYEKLEKIISNIDPAILIPCGFKGESKNHTELKTKEEFIKYFGYANATEEGYINLAKKRVEEDQKSVEVIFLK